MTEQRNITQHFYDSAKIYPNNTAIIYNDVSISYSELLTEVEITAHYFLSKGIKPGDRVLVFVPMSIDLYRIVLALFSIGASAIFLDEWVSKKRMEICCSIAQCTAFVGITKAHLLRLFSKELRKIPITLKISGHKQRIFENLAGTSDNLPFLVNEHETALITFTTGSTGIPKAAKRSHYFLDEQLKALKEKVKSTSDDTELTTLPIVLFINLGVGATSIICNFNPRKLKKFKVEKTIETLKKYQVNRIVASPYFFKVLSEKIIHSKTNFSEIKQIFTGGAPVFPLEAKLIDKAFPGIQSEVVFGSTEAEPISAIKITELIQLEEFALKNGLPVGKPVEQAEVKIIEIQDKPIVIQHEEELKILPTNGIGEIIVAGKHVLKEYLNNEEALLRNKIFIGEKVYHRTGDSGFLDDNGLLYLTGRCATIIHYEKKIIYPFLIENALQNIKGIEIGTILQLNSEIIVVAETTMNNEKATITELINELELPKHTLIWMNIPRDPRHHSKVDYEILRQKLNS